MTNALNLQASGNERRPADRRPARRDARMPRSGSRPLPRRSSLAVHCANSFKPAPNERGGFRLLAERAQARGDRRGGLRPTVAETDEGERSRPAPASAPGVAPVPPSARRSADPERRRLVLQLQHHPRREFRADAGRARHLALSCRAIAVASASAAARRACQRHLRAHALNALQQTEPVALGRGEEAEEPDRILAHLRLDQVARGLPARRRARKVRAEAATT